jgi:hypothetical protein
VHPITGEQLQEWIAEKRGLQDQTWFFDRTTSFFVASFVREDNGVLTREFGPQQMPSEEAAIGAAQSLARSDYAGVIAWKRTAQIAGGRDGTPEVLYQVGEVPILE